MSNISIKGKNGINVFMWLIVAIAICFSVYRFPLGRSGIIGDEGLYLAEVDYFAGFGAYNALSQGTSFFYTLVVYLFAKLSHVSFLVSMRVLAIFSFIVCSYLIFTGFKKLKNLPEYSAQVAVTFFVATSIQWLRRGLPDFVAMAFVLGALHMLFDRRNYGRICISALLLFIAFGMKPVHLLAVPCFSLIIFLNGISRSAFFKNLLKAGFFAACFSALFIVYHIPSYKLYHRLVLEDKNHTYAVDGTRLESPTRWTELNNYFALYNPNHRANKWGVTWEEIEEFKKLHPDVNLEVGVIEFPAKHFGIWIGKMTEYTFQTLPYYIQSGFFFYKWTIANSVLHSINTIYIITLVLIGILYFIERKFLVSNYLYICVWLLYFWEICAIEMAQVEINWYLACLPFMAAPAIVFLARRLNIYLLLVLQFVYIMLLI